MAYRTLMRKIDQYVNVLDALERAREKEDPKMLRHEERRVCRCGTFDKCFNDVYDQLEKMDDVLDKRHRRGKDYDKLMANFPMVGRHFITDLDIGVYKGASIDSRTSPADSPPHHYEPIDWNCCPAGNRGHCRDWGDLYEAAEMEEELEVQNEKWPSHEWPFVGFCLECYDGGDRKPNEWRKWKDIYRH